MKLKLIATDLDGTLLTGKKEISEKTKEVLARTAREGVCLVPSTGRAFAAVPREVLQLPGVEYVITSNGAAIYSVREDRCIYSCPMSAISVDALLETPGLVAGGGASEITAEAFVCGVPFADAVYVEHPEEFGATEYGIGYVKRTRRPVKDIRRFLREHREEIDSIAFVSRHAEALEECRRRIEDQVPEIMTTSSFPNLLEIGHIRAGKGKTLSYLLRMLGISPDEAAAFGDAANDLDMLRSVRYGVAVGNAAEECRRAAAFVTETNEQDGVAKAILRILDET